MTIIRSRDFTGVNAWDALCLVTMNDITVRLHWTDRPYPMHLNDGQEVFAVLEGRIRMRYRDRGEDRVTVLEPGDIFIANLGTEHAAAPLGEARVLVVETEGSI